MVGRRAPRGIARHRCLFVVCVPLSLETHKTSARCTVARHTITPLSDRPPPCSLSSAAGSANRSTLTRSPAGSPSSATVWIARSVRLPTNDCVVEGLNTHVSGRRRPLTTAVVGPAPAGDPLRRILIFTQSLTSLFVLFNVACGACDHLSKGHSGGISWRYDQRARRVRSPTNDDPLTTAPPHTCV